MNQTNCAECGWEAPKMRNLRNCSLCPNCFIKRKKKNERVLLWLENKKMDTHIDIPFGVRKDLGENIDYLLSESSDEEDEGIN